MLASAIRTGDRGATGTFETLPRVLPGPRGNKEWYLCAARAGLLIGVAKPPQICQPRHDHRREVRPNRPATPPFSPIMARHRRRLAAEKDPACGTQRGHLLVAAPHRRPTAAAHPPARISTAQ